MPDATAPTASRAVDDTAFDELLRAPPPAAPAASAPEALELAAPPHDHVAPGWNEFSSGWDLGIYQDPVLCGILAGFALGVLGVFIVLRRAVFVTAAVSQSAGLGVAIAFLLDIHAGLKVPPVVTAFAFALAATGLLSIDAQRLRLPREAILGFAYVAASAAAVLVGDRISQEAHDVAAILFGTAVLVRPLDVWMVGCSGLFVLVAVVWVALEVSVATRAIGALPVFAFAVLPAMAALALLERLRYALVAAALVGGTAGGGGYLLAFFMEFPVGASRSWQLRWSGGYGASRVVRRAAAFCAVLPGALPNAAWASEQSACASKRGAVAWRNGSELRAR
jgi:zinc transport system permease protein